MPACGKVSSQAEAELLRELLSSKIAHEFLSSLIFFDAKRPITIDVLSRLSFAELARELGKLDDLQEYTEAMSISAEGQTQLCFITRILSEPLWARNSMHKGDCRKVPKMICPVVYTSRVLCFLDAIAAW